LDEQPLAYVAEQGKPFPAPDKDIPVGDPEYGNDADGNSVLFPAQVGRAVEPATEKYNGNDETE